MPVSRLDFGTAATNDGEEISTAFVKLDANDALLEAAIDALSASTTVLAAAIDAIEADYVVAADIAGMLETSDIGSTVQAADADLDTWAAITRASGFDAFVATPSSDNLAALLTDETGSGGGFVRSTAPTISEPTITGNMSVGGRLGVGTSPAVLLHLYSATQYDGMILNNGSNNVAGFAGNDAGNDGGFLFLSTGGTPVVFLSATAGSYITSGNFGLGTSSMTAQLHTTGTVRFANFGAGTLTTDASGNVTATSDARLKENIHTLPLGLDFVDRVESVSYRWKAESGFDLSNRYAGFLAQNVAEAAGEHSGLVTGTGSDGHMTLQERGLLAAAYNAISELKEIVCDLQSRVEALEVPA